VFLGLTSIAFMTSSTAIVQTRAKPEMRGRVLALQAMVFLGSTPIGGPIVGTIAQRYGARWSLGIGAVGCYLAALIAARHTAFRRRVSEDVVVAAEATAAEVAPSV
jgi:MFS family permease